jgi:Glycosyl transferase family 2
VTDVTIFCAVWHQDGSRHELLKTHRENLRQQSLPVQVLYVFDGGDTPPQDLDAETIAANNPLTIYQAWNLALAAVRTPLVMNLNLDDRLAPDAVEKLIGHLQDNDAVLAGGDWRICYSQEETDLVSACYAAVDTPFSLNCPPAIETPRRLGSGTSDRLTFGPATLWRMSAHAKIPRYPWRLKDGTLIRSVADGAFWSILSHLGAKLSRLPQVIGNYHFHPGEQAEYRVKESLADMLPNIMKV